MLYNYKPETIKDTWKLAYRMARCPDYYLADALILAYPVRYLIFAIECLDNRAKLEK